MAFPEGIEHLVKDDSNLEAPPVRFLVRQNGYGLYISALNDAGEEMAEVALEFFDNAINAHLYSPDEEQPIHSHVFTSDVATARKEKLHEAE